MTIEDRNPDAQTDTDADLSQARKSYPAWVSAVTLIAFLGVAYSG